MKEIFAGVLSNVLVSPVKAASSAGCKGCNTSQRCSNDTPPVD